MICRTCHTYDIPAGNLRQGRYLCSRCRVARPAYQASIVRHQHSPSYKEHQYWRVLSWRRKRYMEMT